MPRQLRTKSAEVEFSLALNCRTGRFFVSRDMIEDIGDMVHSIRYWRISSAKIPSGLTARILGRLAARECSYRANFNAFDRIVPRIRREAPVVFTDPFQVMLYKIKPEDVVVCYDMGPVTHPELYAPGAQKIYLKVFAEVQAVKPHIVFISESSKSEYESLYGKSYNTGTVVYPNIRLEIGEGPLEPIAGISPPFLLTVGSVGSRKNHARSIQAFQRSGLPSKGFSYVIAGGNESGHETALSLAAATPAVHVTGYVTEPQLRWLYANATGFVLPSLLEGFGFPAAEAIYRGLVPLVSRGGALHEITGDAAVLVDPLSVDSIAGGMRELVSMTQTTRANRLRTMLDHLSGITREAARQGWRSALEAATLEHEPSNKRMAHSW